MKRLSILFLAIVSVVGSSAQLATGEWRMHFAYNAVHNIAQTNEKVYAVSDGSLFSVDKYDNTIEYYSKLSELNGTNIRLIAYDTDSRSLLIVYQNGLIDIMRSGGVENISDLYQKQMSESKTINAIFCHQKKAYLAADFGILVLNIPKNEIQSTYYIGDEGASVKVIGVTIIDNMIYAATESDIYYADMTTANLMDYSHWHKLPKPDGQVGSLVAFGNTLLTVVNGQILAWQDGAWKVRFSSRKLNSITVSDGRLFGYTDNRVCVIARDFSFYELPVFFGSQQAVYDSQYNAYWFAAHAHGLGKYSVIDQSYDAFLPEGPQSNFAYRMQVHGGKLYSVPGGRWADRYQRLARVMVYDNEKWTNTDYGQLTALAQQDVYDFMNVAIDPQDESHFFVTSYGCGLFEYKDMQAVKRYTEANASFKAAAPSAADFYTRLDGAIYDSKGNLWITAAGAYGPTINILSPNGQWTGLDIYNGGQKVIYNTPQPIVIDNHRENYKWIANGRDVPGLGLIDDNGTPTDPSDDRTIFRTSLHDLQNHDLSLELVFTCAQESNGDIWLGTLTGPIKISASTDFFSSDLCERILVARNDDSGLYDYLLQGERINAIAFDGAGRKWMGTQGNGVFLLNEEANETIEHFTTDNSPLPSNTILSIAINDATGEVFLGTDAGLVSYQSDASAGHDDYDGVYAYPNPVAADYAGVITIVGLKTDTQIRITDIAGSLLAQLESNGGTAVWDGKDQAGRRVATGIYLVQGLDANQEEHFLTKILVINQ